VISAANEWKGWWMTALTGGGGRGVGVMKEGIVQKMCEGHGTTWPGGKCKVRIVEDGVAIMVGGRLGGRSRGAVQKQVVRSGNCNRALSRVPACMEDLLVEVQRFELHGILQRRLDTVLSPELLVTR